MACTPDREEAEMAAGVPEEEGTDVLVTGLLLSSDISYSQTVESSHSRCGEYAEKAHLQKAGRWGTEADYSTKRP